MGLWFDMASLGVEASQVISLRLARIAAGGAKGESESRRMVEEKVAAASRAGMTLATGGSPEAVIRQLRRKVRANRRRLSS
ncbi:hypothetical protein EV668_4732 [Enterovirga rhinocerotis]|uniref:Uncharacterized protein n=2 Tax=Enterovirga rhinocerotis TaxID=1339210 RepID=A0A4R7BIX4_9HYPH|nr:hypothetical protein EV668_4732 [Enterovirga rhinocerotis]